MNLNFEVVIFLPICARKQAKHNKRMVERQMIKVLARPNNFVDKEKVANLNETLHKILRFLMWFGFHEFWSYVFCLNVVELMKQNFKIYYLY